MTGSGWQTTGDSRKDDGGRQRTMDTNLTKWWGDGRLTEWWTTDAPTEWQRSGADPPVVDHASLLAIVIDGAATSPTEGLRVLDCLLRLLDVALLGPEPALGDDNNNNNNNNCWT